MLVQKMYEKKRKNAILTGIRAKKREKKIRINKNPVRQAEILGIFNKDKKTSRKNVLPAGFVKGGIKQ